MSLRNNNLEKSTRFACAVAELHWHNTSVDVDFESFTGPAQRAHDERMALSKLLETGSVPLSTAKVFVCGHFGIGKTTMVENLQSSLIRRGMAAVLPQPRDNPGKPEERTKGIHTRVIAVPPQPPSEAQDSASRAQEPASLRLYDFAGQLEYHIVHELLFADLNAAFVVCVDLSQPRRHVQERLLYWLRFICTCLVQAPGSVHGDPADSAKPAVFVVGTKADKPHPKNQLPQLRLNTSRACALPIQELFPGVNVAAFDEHIHIHGTTISNGTRTPTLLPLNCHKPGHTEFVHLRKILHEHWQRVVQQDVQVPQIVEAVAEDLEKCRKTRQGPWDFHNLFEWVKEHGHIIVRTPKFDENLFQMTLKYLHARGDVLWFSDLAGLSAHVFVSPNWLLKEVVGPALAPPHFVGACLSTERGEASFDDFKNIYAQHLDPELAVLVLKRMLLCYEIPQHDGNNSQQQRRFMLPGRIKEPFDLSAAWPRKPSFDVYGGRRLLIQDQASHPQAEDGTSTARIFMFPPGTFPRVQVKLRSTFGDTLELWQNAFFGSLNGVQCLGQIRENQIDVWVRAAIANEDAARVCLEKVLGVIKDEAEGIGYVELALSPRQLAVHNPTPAAYKLDDLGGLDRQKRVMPTHPSGGAPEFVYKVLLERSGAGPGSDWQKNGFNWAPCRWQLDSNFDSHLTYSINDCGDVLYAELPQDELLYSWIQDQMHDSMTLSRVVVVKSSTMLTAFHARMEQTAKQRAKLQGPFHKNFGAGNNEKARMLGRMTEHFVACGNNFTNVMLLWHGCKEEVADEIIAGGAATLGTTDAGYFGSGIYLSPQAAYAMGYSTGVSVGVENLANASGEHVLLLCAVCIGLAYPVTRNTDYVNPATHKETSLSRFFGRGLRGGCDTHYTQVVRRAVLDETFQTTPRAGDFDFEEVVVSQSAQVLPIAKVYAKVNTSALARHLLQGSP